MDIGNLNGRIDEYLELDKKEKILNDAYAKAINVIKHKKALLLNDINGSIGDTSLEMKFDKGVLRRQQKTKYSIHDRVDLHNTIIRQPDLLSLFKAEVVSAKVEDLLPDFKDNDTGTIKYGLCKNVFMTTTIKEKR